MVIARLVVVVAATVSLTLLAVNMTDAFPMYHSQTATVTTNSAGNLNHLLAILPPRKSLAKSFLLTLQ